MIHGTNPTGAGVRVLGERMTPDADASRHGPIQDAAPTGEGCAVFNTKLYKTGLRPAGRRETTFLNTSPVVTTFPAISYVCSPPPQ